MTSRAGAREQRTGEFRARAQGSAGEPALRIGSALPLIRLASGLLTALCLVIVWVSMTANGVMVIATIFAAIFLWSIGAYTRGFWSR